MWHGCQFCSCSNSTAAHVHVLMCVRMHVSTSATTGVSWLFPVLLLLYRLHEELLGYVTRGPDEPAVTHILIHTRQPVTLRFTNKTAVALKSSVSLHDTLTHFAAVQQAWAAQQQADAEGCRDPTAARDQQQECSSRSSSSTDFGVDGIEFEPKAQGKGILTADTLANSGLNAADKGTKSSAGINKADVTAAAAAAVLAANASSTALRAAALQLFGSSTGCLGIPGTCHRVCAVPAAAGGIAGVTYCLEQYTPGAADSLADVLSSMKASLLPGARLDRWALSAGLVMLMCVTHHTLTVLCRLVDWHSHPFCGTFQRSSPF
jgi:hypothetical protein